MPLNLNSPLTIAVIVVAALVIIYFAKPKPVYVEEENEDLKEEQVAVSKVAETKEEDDLELVAAIIGALSAYMDVPVSKLRINSIKRVDGNNSVWREEALRP
jgi:hypothetical protein